MRLRLYIPFLVLSGSGWLFGAEATLSEIEALKADVEALRAGVIVARRDGPHTPIPTQAEKDEAWRIVNAEPVGTEAYRNAVAVLIRGQGIQIWHYNIQNDNRGLFDDAAGTGIIDTNEASDNDCFRIRRAELPFTMDIHESEKAAAAAEAQEAVKPPLPPERDYEF